jgi:tetratricopeptide (TPR) repeat protein
VGILSFLFGNRKTPPRKIRVQVSSVVGSAGPSKAEKLLKKATSQKKKGDLEEAIVTLRKAYAAISKGTAEYPIDSYLRLPMYLQAAGRPDEAWREFHKLLSGQYPKPILDSEVRPMEDSSIYDKMRLFLQREKRPKEAVAYGVLAIASWQIGLERQKRRKERVTKADLRRDLTGLLKKAKKPRESAALTELVWERLKGCPNVDLAALKSAVDRVVRSPD